MMMAYGYKLEAKDQYVESVETFQAIIKQIFTKGFLVDILPICTSIPGILPLSNHWAFSKAHSSMVSGRWFPEDGRGMACND
jgi:hypothetical protein